MTEKTVDLKKLILIINDNKDINANLCLEEGCTFETDDPKPLIKVINYIINYLTHLTSQALEISLDLHTDKYILSLMAFTTEGDLPPLSNRLDDALQDYNASHELVHNTGKYVQIKLIFNR